MSLNEGPYCSRWGAIVCRGQKLRQKQFPGHIGAPEKGWETVLCHGTPVLLPFGGKSVHHKAVRGVPEGRLPSFLVRPAHCRRGTLSEPCRGMWSQTPRLSGSLTWVLLLDLSWGPSRTGRKRYRRRGGGWWVGLPCSRLPPLTEVVLANFGDLAELPLLV